MTPPGPDDAGVRRFELLARVWPLAAGALLLALVVTLVRRPFRAFDTYFHLRFGDEFRSGMSVSDPGQLSPSTTNDWLPTQWLPQELLAWTMETAGRTGLTVAFAALVVAFVAGSYLLLRRFSGPSVAATLTLVVVVGCLPSLSLRPQVLSYLLMMVVLAAWDRSRRTGRAPWLLIPVAWVWATCHGMWILGVVASAALAVAVAVERSSWRRDRGEGVRLLSVPVAMAAATMLTPAGFGLMGSVLLVNSRAEYFHEWRAPELATLGALPVTALLAAAVVLLVLRSGVRPFELTLLGLGGIFAIYSHRTLPLAAIVLACLVAGEWSRRCTPGARPKVSARELAVVAALAVGALVLAPLQSTTGDAAADSAPFDARLDGLPDGATVLTAVDVGSVLLWTHPGLDVPVHGYGDVYTDAELRRAHDLADLAPGWRSDLAALRPDAALLRSDTALAAALVEEGWTQTQESGDLVLLGPPPA